MGTWKSPPETKGACFKKKREKKKRKGIKAVHSMCMTFTIWKRRGQVMGWIQPYIELVMIDAITVTSKSRLGHEPTPKRLMLYPCWAWRKLPQEGAYNPTGFTIYSNSLTFGWWERWLFSVNESKCRSFEALNLIIWYQSTSHTLQYNWFELMGGPIS